MGLESLPYPDDDPGDGAAVTTFANKVIGFLSANSKAQECAFQLGFAGLIETNSPGTYPNFSIRETAKCAGFLDNPQQSDKEYFLGLVEAAKQLDG